VLRVISAPGAAESQVKMLPGVPPDTLVTDVPPEEAATYGKAVQLVQQGEQADIRTELVPTPVVQEALAPTKEEEPEQTFLGPLDRIARESKKTLKKAGFKVDLDVAPTKDPDKVSVLFSKCYDPDCDDPEFMTGNVVLVTQPSRNEDIGAVSYIFAAPKVQQFSTSADRYALDEARKALIAEGFEVTAWRNGYRIDTMADEFEQMVQEAIRGDHA
jgi:hypothetical protein